MAGEYLSLTAGTDFAPEIVLFSPRHEHAHVIDHVREKLGV